MEIDNTYLKEQLHDARRYLDLECERLQERIDTMNAYQKMMEQYEAVLEENERLKSELEEQQAESAPMTNVTVQPGGINVQQANTVGK